MGNCGQSKKLKLINSNAVALGVQKQELRKEN